MASAEEKARRIQEETRFLMDQEVKQAEIRFREEVAAQAVRIAEEVVQRSVKPEDDKRLSQSFVADLEGGGKPASTSHGRRWRQAGHDRPGGLRRRGHFLMAASDGAAAIRYARALFELATEKKQSDVVGAELEALAETYAASPSCARPWRTRLQAERAAGGARELLPRLAPSPQMRNFALLLLERGRIGALPTIARAYREMVDSALGRVRATVTSARPARPRHPGGGAARAREAGGQEGAAASHGRPQPHRRHRRPRGGSGVRRQPAHAARYPAGPRAQLSF